MIKNDAQIQYQKKVKRERVNAKRRIARQIKPISWFELTEKYPTQESVMNFIINHYFHNKVKCPRCGHTHKICRNKNLFKEFHCNSCNYTFSIFKGTIFEKSRTDLRKWLFAIHQIMCAKKGISALQLMRDIRVTEKCALRMLRVIRCAISANKNTSFFDSMVEVDETFVGGKPRHSKKLPVKRGRGTKKVPVIGLKGRDSGNVDAIVAKPNEAGQKLSGIQLLNFIQDRAKKETIVFTDDFSGYNILNSKSNRNTYFRYVINHSSKQYVNGFVHTNGIEGFWAILKRGVYGTYHHISEQYMQQYVDEFCYRYNNRFNKTIVEDLMGDCLCGSRAA